MKLLTILVAATVFVGVLIPTAARGQRSGVEVWSQTCGTCHRTQPPDRYTADQWVSIMDAMTLYARLTDREADAVLAFLQSGAKKVAIESSRIDPQLLAFNGPYLPQLDDSGRVTEETFTQLCVACHGKGGKGDGPAAVAFNPRPADYTNPEFQKSRTDTELATSIRDGKGSMPAFGEQLTTTEIAALVKYIRSFEKGK